MKTRRALWLSVSILTGFTFGGCVTAPPEPMEGTLSLSPTSVQQGESFLVQHQVRATSGAPIAVDKVFVQVDGPATEEKLKDRPRSFACGTGSCSLVGVGLDIPPGKYPVSLRHEDGRVLSVAEIKITPSTKPVERLRVDPARVRLSDADQKRVDEERVAVHAVLNDARKEVLESVAFRLPVNSMATSSFGKKRVFNGENRGYHTGVDLRAGTGVRIRAANSGVVRLAQEFFLAGNHVLVDHGGGVFSSYSHLSEVLVKPGQRIAVGDVLGKSGATGRVTAPHLHWTIRIEGHAVDPLQFLEVLSKIPADASIAGKGSKDGKTSSF